MMHYNMIWCTLPAALDLKRRPISSGIKWVCTSAMLRQWIVLFSILRDYITVEGKDDKTCLALESFYSFYAQSMQCTVKSLLFTLKARFVFQKNKSMLQCRSFREQAIQVADKQGPFCSAFQEAQVAWTTLKFQSHWSNILQVATSVLRNLIYLDIFLPNVKEEERKSKVWFAIQIPETSLNSSCVWV